MIQRDGTLTERSTRTGETAKNIAANADLLLHAKPKQAEAAIVFSPLVPLLGGYGEENSRNAMHKALAGYHRMFFERNLAVEVLSSRELAGEDLQKYKLIVLPYPLMMTKDEAAALKTYVKNGGQLFVEARPGWVNEDGHAEAAVPGFGWTEMCGLRESSIDPAKEVAVRWSDAEFTGMSFAEHFTVLDEKARVLAKFSDGTPAAVEHGHGKGSVLVLGTFAGQENETKPVRMHPLGGSLGKIWETQMGNIEKASAAMAETITNGGLVHLFGSGHSVLPVQDMFPRYGAYPGFRPLMDMRLMWTNVIGSGGAKGLLWLERREGYAAILFENEPIRRGDVMLVFSHGGLNSAGIEVLQEAKKRGLITAAVTSMDNYGKREAMHSSGKKLADVADIVIDK